MDGAAGLMVRKVLLMTATAIAVAVTVPAPAQAHAGLALTVNDDGRGSVSVEVAWADGHPVTEGMAGTLIAVGPAGTQVGPAPLTRLPGASTLVLSDALPAGAWTVTVDVALPGIGRCAAPVTVVAADATARPGTTRCAPSAAPSAVAAAAPAPSGGRPWWPVVAGGAALLAVLGWWLTRARR